MSDEDRIKLERQATAWFRRHRFSIERRPGPGDYQIVWSPK